MLEQLLVELEYPFTANCQKCNQILFEIRIIDQFIKVHGAKNTEKAAKDAAKFYMLHSEILPSTIFVEKNSYLSQQNPFYMQFLGEIKCDSCKQRVGIKMLTVSSDFHYPELLNRHFIDATKVRIKTKKEDVTNQLLQRFYQEWENQTEVDENSLAQKIKPTKPISKQQQQSPRQKNKKNTKKQDKNKRQGKVEENSRESQEVKYLRKQLEQQSEQNKQVVHEIIASIDFFNEVLTSLQKRVSQAQNVCNVLKEKVEKMIPLLRKKNQQ